MRVRKTEEEKREKWRQKSKRRYLKHREVILLKQRARLAQKRNSQPSRPPGRPRETDPGIIAERRRRESERNKVWKAERRALGKLAPRKPLTDEQKIKATQRAKAHYQENRARILGKAAERQKAKPKKVRIPPTTQELERRLERKRERKRVWNVGYQERNKAKMAAYRKRYAPRYFQLNKEKIFAKRKLAESTPEGRLVRNLRTRLKAFIESKIGSRKALFGCTPSQLREHIERQFTKGMTWANYGHMGWHIDHIMPCSAFDLTREDQARICFNWQNLQPLWAADNLSKSDKLTHPQSVLPLSLV